MYAYQITAATAADRLPIYRMLELYQYELSDIWDQDLDAHGEYGYALDRYWSSESCFSYVARVAGNYAGFALANQSVVLGPGGTWMDQFFVLKKYRRSGVGWALATRVISDIPGQWEIGQMTENHNARAFWQSVIEDVTSGNFSEHQVTEGWWRGSIQRFISSGESS
jgi:predicted acetyltransferase